MGRSEAGRGNIVNLQQGVSPKARNHDRLYLARLFADLNEILRRLRTGRLDFCVKFTNHNIGHINLTIIVKTAAHSDNGRQPFGATG